MLAVAVLAILFVAFGTALPTVDSPSPIEGLSRRTTTQFLNRFTVSEVAPSRPADYPAGPAADDDLNRPTAKTHRERFANWSRFVTLTYEGPANMAFKSTIARERAPCVSIGMAIAM